MAAATALADGPEPPVVGVGPPPGLAATPPEGVVVVAVDCVVVVGVELVVPVVGVLDVAVEVVGTDVVVGVVVEAVLEVVAGRVCERLLPPHPAIASATTSAPRRVVFKACASFVGSVRREPV